MAAYDGNDIARSEAVAPFALLMRISTDKPSLGMTDSTLLFRLGAIDQ